MKKNISPITSLDKLIERWTKEILLDPKYKFKLCDLVKLIQLRYKILPKDDHKEIWDMIENIRIEAEKEKSAD